MGAAVRRARVGQPVAGLGVGRPQPRFATGRGRRQPGAALGRISMDTLYKLKYTIMRIRRLIPAVAFASMSVVALAQGDLKSGIDVANLDRSVSPAENFYEFACGGWMKSHPLPAAYARYGSFDQLAENNDKRINTILNELKSGSFAAGTTERKLSDLYKLAIDSVRRNKLGVEPAMPVIRQMEAAKTVGELFAIQL